MLRHFTVVLGALCAFVTGAAAETPLERGSYLVNAVMVCDGCHTPRGPGGYNMGRRFSGGPQVFDGPAYTVRGSNITSDRDTGIGAWSKDDIKRLLIQGVRPNGVQVAPVMPYNFYKILTPGDLDAIARLPQDDQAGEQRSADANLQGRSGSGVASRSRDIDRRQDAC